MISTPLAAVLCIASVSLSACAPTTSAKPTLGHAPSSSAVPPPPGSASVDWGGIQVAGARRFGPADRPTALLRLTNLSRSRQTWEFDLVVLTADPGRLDVSQATGASALPAGIWSLHQTEPEAARRALVSPGASVTVPLDWNLTDHVGRRVASGRYHLLVSARLLPKGVPASLLTCVAEITST